MQLRMTSQREVILQELRKSCAHPTADELYDLVKKTLPRISLATVYRNLEILSEAGIISKIEVGGRQKRYDTEIKSHHHIYCVKCHRVDNLEGYESEVDLQEIVGREDYEVTDYRLDITGICPDCEKLEKITGGYKMSGCGCACGGSKKDKAKLTEEQRSILEALEKIDSPCGTKDIAAESGLEPKVVSSKMCTLKKKGYVGSPARCKYGITAEGKAALVG